MSLTDWEQQAAADETLISYQLHIVLARSQWIVVGRLGRFHFPAGRYRYTGSARRHLITRVRRHLAKEKSLRWHIDYLLNAATARVTAVELSSLEECCWQQQLGGEIIATGFGASDCRAGCGSHLKFLGPLQADSTDKRNEKPISH
jgi:Uri superfamily endonuclease